MSSTTISPQIAPSSGVPPSSPAAFRPRSGSLPPPESSRSANATSCAASVRASPEVRNLPGIAQARGGLLVRRLLLCALRAPAHRHLRADRHAPTSPAFRPVGPVRISLRRRSRPSWWRWRREHRPCLATGSLPRGARGSASTPRAFTIRGRSWTRDGPMSSKAPTDEAQFAHFRVSGQN